MKPKEILDRARQENRTVLTEIEAKQILMQSGINCTDTQLAATKEAAVELSEKFGYPVVLKVSSVDISHKSDAIKDPSFGPVIMFGLGGVFVEVLKDVAFRVIPIEESDAEDMINEIKGKKLLEGYRGQEPADVGYLQQMLLKLSDFVDATPEIQEIDMNPVFSYRDGAVVVDARIILSEE